PPGSIRLSRYGTSERFIAEGTTIVAPPDAKSVIERAAAAAHTMRPDALSRGPRSPVIETLKGKRVFDDGAHRVELYEFSNPHCAEMIIAWPPKEKILFEADMLDITYPDHIGKGGEDTACDEEEPTVSNPHPFGGGNRCGNFALWYEASVKASRRRSIVITHPARKGEQPTIKALQPDTAKMTMKRRLNAICFFLLLGMAVKPAPAQQTRGVTPEDYFAFEFLSDPHISPDGKLVAYVVTKVDRAPNRRTSAMWLVAADGSRAPWRFTTSPQSATSPRWSPDGRSLAFLSSRPAAEASAQEQPRPQVYTLSLGGGEAQRVTNLKNGVSVFQWSPNGSRLVVVSRVGPSDSRPESKDRSDVRHYKDTSYKFNDTGWFDDRRAHLWVVDIKSGAAK